MVLFATLFAAWNSWIIPQKIELMGLALVLALTAALLLTPVAMRIARAAGVMDAPHARRVHTVPTPRWGGLAIFTAFLLTVFALAPFRYYLLHDNMLNKKVVGILLCGLLMTAIGALDDKYSLPAKYKLLGQILVATLVVAVFHIRFVVVFDVNIHPQNWFGVPLTILWIVAVTNTINLIDGLDGLAAGIASIAAISFIVISLIKGSIGEALLAAALLGACLGFLRYNFHPAKVFMGDAGSHFLGFTIAVLSVLQNWKVATGIALAIPVLILAVPIFDTTFAIVRRLRRGQPIFSPDKGHLHHRLLNLGLDHRTVVLMIYLFTAIGCALAVLLAHTRLMK